MIVGGTLSAIVTVVEQVFELPEPSVTVTVTVCGPVPRIVPAGGLCVLTSEPGGVQLSEAVTLPSTLGMAP